MVLITDHLFIGKYFFALLFVIKKMCNFEPSSTRRCSKPKREERLGGQT